VQEVVESGRAVDRAVALVQDLPRESVDALAATKRLLDDLDGRQDLGDWQRTYAELLESPARRALLGAAQARYGVGDRSSLA